MSTISRLTDDERDTLRKLAAHPKLRDKAGEYMALCQKARDLAADNHQSQLERIASFAEDLKTAEANLVDVRSILAEFAA